MTESNKSTRRSFLDHCSSIAMAFGLTTGYGMFATLIGWFLYPLKGTSTSWQFLADLTSFAPGASMTYQTPAGQRVVVTRTGKDGLAQDFIALSSTCPHLGCQVHWESPQSRFYCPCHNGAFDAEGNPTQGPPRDAGQALSRYPLKVQNGLLFIKVPTAALV